MNLKLFVDRDFVTITQTTFPAGETCIRIDDKRSYPWLPLNVKITLDFKSNSDLFDLALLVDAVRRFYKHGVILALEMPYLPYARQDRVCNEGESLSVKVVTDFINSLKFQHVYCKDIHSEVGVALIDNLVHIKQEVCASKVCEYIESRTVVVSPDGGAEKKAFAFAQKTGYNMIRATKVRNVLTGRIESTALVDSLKSASGDAYLILDDIAEGGATFIELAKVIMNDDNYSGEPIYLYVTHGNFSRGLDELRKYFNKIFVDNLMNSDVESDPLIQLI